jgi:hypothetical protein
MLVHPRPNQAKIVVQLAPEFISIGCSKIFVQQWPAIAMGFAQPKSTTIRRLTGHDGPDSFPTIHASSLPCPETPDSVSVMWGADAGIAVLANGQYT